MSKRTFTDCAISVSDIQIKRTREELHILCSFTGRKGNLPRRILLTEANLTNLSKKCVSTTRCSLDRDILRGTNKLSAKIIFSTKELFRITIGTVLKIETIDTLTKTRNLFILEHESSDVWICTDVATTDASDDPICDTETGISTQVIRNASRENTFVAKLCEQLEAEIELLKKDGDKRYPFVNARRISKSEGKYLYALEMDLNPGFQESQRVEILFRNREVSAEVITAADDEIAVLTEEDLGDSIAEGFIATNSWMMLQAQVDRLEQYALFDQKRLIQLLMEKGPQLGGSDDISRMKRGQTKAISYATDHPITMIWGPPGTGKTFVLAQMAIRFARERKSVLLVSHSNVSVDGVTLKILELLRNEKQTKYIRDGKVLRYGYVRSDKLNQEKYATAYNYTLTTNPQFQIEKEELINHRQMILQQGERKEGERVQVENQLRDLRTRMRAAQTAAVCTADIVTTTISKATVDSTILNQHYDVVMFDEASMAYVSQIYAAVTFAREKFICVGDFRQLPPIVRNEENELKKDIFEYLGITDRDGNLYNHPWLVLLDKQRRMHADIAAFANQYIYNSLLKNDSSISKERAQFARKAPFIKKALGYVNLAGCYGPAYKDDNNSRYNMISALACVKLAIYTAKETEDTVGIITPYAEQVRLIRLLLKEYAKISKYRKRNITCATVHQFQGSETQTIIFDMVENYPSSRLGYMFSKNANDVLRLINVAVTRAKSKFILVANDDFWESKVRGEGKSPILREFFDYMRLNAAQMNYNELVEQTDGDEIISLYKINDGYSRLFAKDVREAAEAVEVFFPDASLHDSAKRMMTARIQECVSRDIPIRILAAEHCILPDAWSDCRYKSSNTTLPLTRVDRDVLWYGLPLSNVCYRVGNKTIATRTPAIARIVSPTFIKEISKLQKLDRELALSGAHIEQTYQPEEDDNLSLAEFIENRYICPECGSRIRCSLGRYTYMECKACQYKQRIDPEVVDAFLREQKILCPVHGCKMKAKIMRNGMMYIMCECDGERHVYGTDDF